MYFQQFLQDFFLGLFSSILWKHLVLHHIFYILGSVLFIEVSDCKKEVFLMHLNLFNQSLILILNFLAQIIFSFIIIYLLDIHVLIE